jgi:hypothetical protein
MNGESMNSTFLPRIVECFMQRAAEDGLKSTLETARICDVQRKNTCRSWGLWGDHDDGGGREVRKYQMGLVTQRRKGLSAPKSLRMLHIMAKAGHSGVFQYQIRA